jgi:acetolactate synthase-1/2/3 large subunit
VKKPEEASALVAEAIRSLYSDRPGPAAIECAIDMWGRKSADEKIAALLPVAHPALDEDAIKDAAKRLASSKCPLIICGGGAQGASEEITKLSEMLQAPVLGYRRGRGVLSSKSPFSVTLPLGRELWGETDVALGVGTHMLYPMMHWGIDDKIDVIRVDADKNEPARIHKPAVSLIGDAQPILKRLVEMLPSFLSKRDAREDEMLERHAKMNRRFEKLAPQKAFLDAIRDELPEDGIFIDEVTQMGFAARLMLPVYKPRTFLSPGYQDNLGWGFATALGAQDARRDVPVVSINGDGGFLYTANELATAMRHKIPLVAIVFSDGSFGNVRRIQEEQFGNRLIASDLANPDFVKFAESFGAAAERAHNADELRGALRRAFKRRDGPTLIDVPVGPMPSPWEFILMPKNRGV